MKSALLFILSFLIFGLLTFGCGKVFAITGAQKDGYCYAWYWDHGEIFPYNANMKIDESSAPDFVNLSVAYGGGSRLVPTTLVYRWTGSTWQRWASYDSVQNVIQAPSYISYMESFGIPQATYPSSYWPDGPPDAENCSDVQVQCSSLAGNTLTEYFAVTDTAPYCWNECEIVPNSGVGVTIPGTSIEIRDMLITGDPAEAGCTEPLEQTEINNCQEAEDYCNEACKGLDMNFSCDQETGDYTCGCTYPPYQRQYDPDTNEMKSDTDGDGLTNDDPAETDMDDDGITDDLDTPDPDNDGHTTQDKDSDNDGQNNRGTFTWADQNADWGAHNGTGADPDIDGDGTPNGSDDDIDGDGIPNGNDPDIDGDGVGNSSDLDADGDGILDGADTDADGDGLTGGDDPDADGSDADAGDTNQDGTVDGNDEPAPEESYPTDEEVQGEIDGVSNNNYDGTISSEDMPEQTDFQGMAQTHLDNNPIGDLFDGSEVRLQNIDSCIDFTNPYTQETESFCFNKYDSEWRAMGVILVGLTMLYGLFIFKS